MRKLTDTEAAKLVRFLERNCKPIAAADQAEMLYWVRRLEGPRS
mgnify:CR=1 FL=1